MKRHSLFCIVAIVLLFFPAFVHGQIVTVSEARNLPQNSWVVLSGNIVNALPGGRNYTFRDSSGEITVDIDHRVWRGLTVGASDMIEIRGEINMNRGLVSVRARALSRNGPVNVRPGQAVTLTRPTTISEARNLPHDSWVILAGNITLALPGGRQYSFRDSSGEMVIEIDQNVWRGLFIGESDLVEISGELRTNQGLASLEVRFIRRI